MKTIYMYTHIIDKKENTRGREKESEKTELLFSITILKFLDLARLKKSRNFFPSILTSG